MHIQESGEMYFETILILSKKGKHVRSLDVAEYMGCSKPSISRAVGLLKNGGYIISDTDGYLTLTDAGAEIACKIYERHRLLTDFLIHLGVDKKLQQKMLAKWSMTSVISLSRQLRNTQKVLKNMNENGAIPQ